MAEKGAQHPYEVKRGGSRRAVDRPAEYQPKYRVKGEQLDNYDDHEHTQFGARDDDDQHDGGLGSGPGDRSGRQRYDVPLAFPEAPDDENPSNSQSSYHHGPDAAGARSRPGTEYQEE